ncbi:MAG: binding-protein-dependent transport system inner rane component [Herbinix sp.]|jgi:NitT/TauT family transport system permease protein|nr:binding-protein-dependent transport system inner rane component [Herbinix sp.]
MKTLKHIVVSLLIFIGLWQLIYLIGGFQEALFPAPFSVGKAIVTMFLHKDVYQDIGASMYRFVIGYLLAVASGILLGLLLGWFPRVFNYVNPIIQVLRPISPIAWLPFIVLWFGIGDIPAIVIIFIAAFYPILLTTAASVGNIDPIYLKVAKNFGIRRHRVLFTIVFPAAFPQIMNSIHIALGSAWVFLVAGEMTGAQSGLGFRIIDARNNLRMDHLLATIVIIGIIGLLLDSLIKVIEKKILSNWGKEAKEGGKYNAN